MTVHRGGHRGTGYYVEEVVQGGWWWVVWRRERRMEGWAKSEFHALEAVAHFYEGCR